MRGELMKRPIIDEGEHKICIDGRVENSFDVLHLLAKLLDRGFE
jgi:hypothetical protein